MIAAAIFGLSGMLLGAAAMFAVRPWLRAGAYCLVLATLIGIWSVSLGRPRPLFLWRSSGFVVAYTLDEGRAIDIWLMPDGTREPLSIGLPWNLGTAAQLRAAMQQAKQHPGMRVRMERAGKFSKRGGRMGQGGTYASAPRGAGQTGASLVSAHPNGGAGAGIGAGANVQFRAVAPPPLPAKTKR